VWDELLSQLEALDARVTRLERLIQTAMPTHPHASLLIALQALQALRGIDSLTAATIVSELGDFAQFAHPRAVMSSVGLVPSETSSGAGRHQGPITKTGNAQVRRVLVEAAHSHRYPPTKRGRSAQRVGKAPEAWHLPLNTIDWRAQQRLHARLRRLSGSRGKAQTVTAVARELCGYCWEIAVWVRAETARTEAIDSSALYNASHPVSRRLGGRCRPCGSGFRESSRASYALKTFGPEHALVD